MPAFITKRRGMVVRIAAKSAELGGASPFSVRIAGQPQIGNVGNANSRVLITQVARTETTNHQLQHTFGNSIYAYVFGDRVGELKLSGVCLSPSCDTDSDGIAAVQSTYENNKLSAGGAPLVLTLGRNVTLLGLLTGMSTEMADPETQLMQWAYRFNTFRAIS